LNPSYSELKISELDMVVAGTKDAVLMVESEANELPEDIMLGAVLFAHNEMQVVDSRRLMHWSWMLASHVGIGRLLLKIVHCKIKLSLL
jgi:hypothetical protein